MIEFLTSSAFDITTVIIGFISTLIYSFITDSSKKEIRNIFKNSTNIKKNEKEDLKLNLQLFDSADSTKNFNSSNNSTVKVLDSPVQTSEAAKDTDELITNLYKQALKQSSIQFWVNIVTSVIGFCFIIFIVIVSGELEWYENLVKFIPGIIIEVVSVMFISQSKETSKQASNYLNRLRKDKQYEKSLEIAKLVTDINKRDETIARIALHFAGIDTEECED